MSTFRRLWQTPKGSGVLQAQTPSKSRTSVFDFWNEWENDSSKTPSWSTAKKVMGTPLLKVRCIRLQSDGLIDFVSRCNFVADCNSSHSMKSVREVINQCHCKNHKKYPVLMQEYVLWKILCLISHRCQNWNLKNILGLRQPGCTDTTIKVG